LWKFDVSASSVANWDTAYNGRALFTATGPTSLAQPITTRPEVNLHPFRGFLVYFGTGKYFETDDNSTTIPTQTLYAVWDRDWGANASDTPQTPGVLVPFNRNQLLQQEILANVGGSYVTSDALITWHEDLATNPTGTPPTTHLGWYVDLSATSGEKQVTNGLFRDGRITFNTIIPSVGLCDAGGTSNTIVLDAISGSRLSISPFENVDEVTVDLDGDGAPDDLDGDGAPDTVPVSSVPSGEKGILSSPTMIENLETGAEYIGSSTSKGTIDILQPNPLLQARGRLFWRQLPQQ
jgi:type IV pilus assembly protein PilY1